MKVNFFRLVCWLLILILVIFVGMQIVEFSLWGQVNQLRGTSLEQLNPISQAHFLRYAVVYPIFLLSDILIIDADYLFAYIAILLIYATSRNIASTVTCSLLKENQRIYFAEFLCLFSLVLVACFMNGRILFAMTGFSLIILNIIKWELKLLSFSKMFFGNILGYFLCSVSTGTFLVAIIFTMLWILLGWQRQKKVIHLWPYIVLGILLSPIIILFVLKNIDFYGGGVDGIVNMLNHGLGSILHSVSTVELYFIGVILFCATIFALFIFVMLVSFRIVLMAIYASVAGGLFGFSTMAVGVPAVIALGVLLLLSPSRNSSADSKILIHSF